MKNTINLLSITAKPLTFWEKFYVWALSIGRYIVIIVELIVLLAFVYKFKVDHDLSTVQSDISTNIASYKSQESKLPDILTYQQRMAAQSAAQNNQVPSYQSFSHTLSLIPSTITIASFDLVTGNNILIAGKINGSATEQLGTIQKLNTTFKDDPLYANVTLSNVSTDSATNITSFQISMGINPMSLSSIPTPTQ